VGPSRIDVEKSAYHHLSQNDTQIAGIEYRDQFLNRGSVSPANFVHRIRKLQISNAEIEVVEGPNYGPNSTRNLPGFSNAGVFALSEPRSLEIFLNVISLAQESGRSSAG
jgi:hypothetical protein